MKRTYRLAAAIVALALAALTGYQMFARTAEEALWGYLPLWLLLGTWVGLVLLLQPLLFRKGRPWRWLAMSGGSALLLGLGFPGYLPVPVLMFVAWVPLLWLESELAEAFPRRAGREFLKYGYVTFVLWNILSTFWVSNTALVAGLFAILANSALMSIPLLLFHKLRRVMPDLGYWGLVAFWMTFEFGHLNWELTWPWLTLGNSFAQVPSWVQWYEYTGAFGGSLWILLANVWLFQLWKSWRAGQPWRGMALRVIAWITLPGFLSAFMYYNYEAKGAPVTVAVVQPNLEPHYQKFTMSARDQFSRFIRLSESVVDSNTAYLVYPETSFDDVETAVLEEDRILSSLQRNFRAYPGLKIVTGISAYHVFEEDEPHSEWARSFTSGGRTVYYEASNAAVQIPTVEGEIQLYYKSKLVPGPENFPYNDLLWFLEPLVKRLDGTTAGLRTQPRRGVFTSEQGTVGPAICYESVFGEYYTGYVKAGAQAIFIMTNDGWWDNTPGHRQHLWFASLRAIETRRSIARSANTGISCFVNQRGGIQQPAPYDTEAALVQDIRFNDEITFYVRWGDVIARLSIFLSAILLLNLIVRSLTDKRSATTG